MVRKGRRNGIVLHLLIFTVGSFFLTVVGAFYPREYPRIGLSRWLELDMEEGSRGLGGRWRTDFENMTNGYLQIADQGRTYIVSQQITGLAFECNASYPVEWVALHQDEEYADYYSFYTKVRYFRTNPDVFNPRSNTFTAFLDLYGEYSGISGNYSCQSVEYPNDVVKSVYVYWQGTNPSNLIYGGRTVDAQSKDGHYVILPCKVSRPDISVNLYKEVNSEWVPTKSPFIRFNPKYGFRVNVKQYSGAYGSFKCAVGEDEDETMLVNVQKGIKELEADFNNTLDSPASVYFNRTTQELICCSDSQKAPKLHTIFCLEKFSCDLRKHQLHTIVNNGKRSHTRGCTSERLYIKDSGLLRCVGDGVDVVRYFYTDLPSKKSGRNSSNLYFNWSDIPPNNMVEMTSTSRSPLYENQNVTFTCDTAFNYFADGMQWALRWKNNQSLQFFRAPAPRYTAGVADGYEPHSLSYQSLRVRLSQDMVEVLCFVPVWNDTMWVNKSMKLDVQETRKPTFPHPEREEIQWTVNSTEKYLNCKVNGSPPPMIRWKKNNKTLLRDNNLSLKRINGSFALLIHRVSHDVQAEYKCIAVNFGGISEKVFQVYVQDAGSSLGFVGVTILSFMVITLLAGMGFLIWKMQLQKKVIDHLAGIVFRDVSTAAGGGGQGSNNDNVGNGTASVISAPMSNGNGSTRGNSDRNPFPSSIS